MKIATIITLIDHLVARLYREADRLFEKETEASLTVQELKQQAANQQLLAEQFCEEAHRTRRIADKINSLIKD